MTVVDCLGSPRDDRDAVDGRAILLRRKGDCARGESRCQTTRSDAYAHGVLLTQHALQCGFHFGEGGRREGIPDSANDTWGFYQDPRLGGAWVLLPTSWATSTCRRRQDDLG